MRVPLKLLSNSLALQSERDRRYRRGEVNLIVEVSPKSVFEHPPSALAGCHR